MLVKPAQLGLGRRIRCTFTAEPPMAEVGPPPQRLIGIPSELHPNEPFASAPTERLRGAPSGY
eukprot:8038638-Alexandrium_andersonii.AAC.1